MERCENCTYWTLDAMPVYARQGNDFHPVGQCRAAEARSDVAPFAETDNGNAFVFTRATDCCGAFEITAEYYAAAAEYHYDLAMDR